MPSKFQMGLIEKGYCDERGAGFCATATQLPRGEYGLVALCVKGNILSIYDVDIRNNLGELLYEIEMKKIQNFKNKFVLIGRTVKFTYSGNLYSFTNIAGVKEALSVMEEETKK
ncbi:MAG: hypothetical protein IKT46_03325 [Clostridia bacterium]|nr:hypothetical protein [Clostridia bacterium]